MAAVMTQWWLVEVGRGLPRLADGPHGERAGVEQALYLLRALGLDQGRTYACAEIRITDVVPIAHGANEDALATLNSIGLKP